MNEQRRYLPTFAELVDRLAIVQLKAIYIPEHKAEYEAEIELIKHDLDLFARSYDVHIGDEIQAIIVLAIANLTIWNNESKARAGGSEQDKLLRFTHSINGVRARAKNVLSRAAGERVDLKVDCLAANLPKEFGNWDVFPERKASAHEREACSTQYVDLDSLK